VLCEAYTVETGTTYADVFLTNGPAKLSSNERQVVAIRNTGLTAYDEFEYRAFYLLPGS
jgi:hypothetical protein